jgi:hypothetical protein
MVARSSTPIPPEEAGVDPEHLKLFIDLIFFNFLLMREERK